jgi:hypothetical protein
MRREALAAGMYAVAGHSRTFPRVQILTVEGLLGGLERPEIVNIDPNLTFRAPPREPIVRVQEELHLPAEDADQVAVTQPKRKAKVVRMQAEKARRRRKASQ